MKDKCNFNVALTFIALSELCLCLWLSIIQNVREISGFHSGLIETLALLGCYAALIGGLLPTFRDSLSIISSRVTFLDCLTLDGTDRLSRNVRSKVPIYPAQRPKIYSS